MRYFGRRSLQSQIYQLIFVATIVGLLIALAFITHHKLRSQGITSGFDFLWHQTGWNMGVALLPASSFDPYWYIIILGLLNTLLAGFFGLLLATGLGTIIGLARLSHSLPARLLAASYVEIFRNTPLILQLFFWSALFSLLPPQTQSYSFAGMYLNNRGFFIPAFNIDNFALLLFFSLILTTFAVCLSLFFVRRWRHMERRQKYLWRLACPFIGVVCALFALISGHVAGTPLISWPQRQGLNFVGGYQIQPEVYILIFAMAIYGGAYIGEIVRGGLQAIDRGQIEAARALSLAGWQSFWLIRLPLALRSMLPILSNQYIWLIKATTLGTVVGFSDIFLVVATGITQSGQTLEFIAILMGSFLLINLTFTAIMSAFNRAIALKNYGEKP